MIRRSTRAGVLALAALALLAAGCGGGSTNADGLSGSTPASIVAAANAFAAKQHSVSLRYRTTMNDYPYELDSLAGHHGGFGRIKIGGAPMVIGLVGDTAYVRGSAKALQNMWDYSAAAAQRNANALLVEKRA